MRPIVTVSCYVLKRDSLFNGYRAIIVVQRTDRRLVRNHIGSLRDSQRPLRRGGYDAAKCVLVSFDSTMRSNLSVGMPIDLICYKVDSFAVTMRRRF